jgi:hypothetical protein
MDFRPVICNLTVTTYQKLLPKDFDFSILNIGIIMNGGFSGGRRTLNSKEGGTATIRIT